MKIYVATNNKNKLKELQALFPFAELLLPQEAGIHFSAEETGAAFLENAFIKARTLLTELQAQTPSRTLVLADDSGLCVDALDGAPGLYSARYAKTVDLQIERILSEMRGVQNRQCRFVCCMVLMLSEWEHYSAQAILEGEIAHSAKGAQGFGYDPIVYLPEYRKTVAELSDAEKNTVSHRARAAQALRRLLTSKN